MYFRDKITLKEVMLLRSNSLETVSVKKTVSEF